jgi:tRNA modification GTPase
MSLHIQDEQTIVAQCSPNGVGAIGLIRISGVDAIQITDAISAFPGSKKLSDQSSHTIHYGKVVDLQGASIDAVLFLLMRAPKTFTGQDTVEITCHNNPFILETIIARAIEAGARLAHAGEFSKRAVINKKIDLIQAEAIKDLIHANSQEGIKRSLAQLEGTLSHDIHNLEQKLVKALALSEASFEFIDEESMEFGSQIKNIITGVTDQIAQLRKSFAQQKQIREGVRIALIGSVNAGKSSLFNTLIGSDRAIVTNQAGTTRDVIEAGLYKDGLYWTLIDTAGLRQTEDTIEAAGIERSYKEAQKADIVLLVIDGTAQLRTAEKEVYKNLLEQYESKIITIQSKSDMPGINQNLTTDYLKVSAYQPESISKLDHMLKAKVSKLFAQDGSAHLLTTRQHSLLLALDQKLGTILPLLEGLIEYELVSHHLQEALSGLAELTGKSISEQGMDTVFREFCVGK